MKKAVFFGDSNTYGYDPRNYISGRYPENVRWTGRLKDALADQWEIEADGMNGRKIPDVGSICGKEKGKTAEGHESEPYSTYLKDLVLSHLPADLFGIMLGSNDILGTPYPDAAAAAEKMRDFIDFIKKIAAENLRTENRGGLASQCDENYVFEILLIAPPYPFWDRFPAESTGKLIDDISGSETMDSEDEPPEILKNISENTGEGDVTFGSSSYEFRYFREAVRLNEMYRKLAEQEKILFFDAGKWGIELAYDGVHFSEKGHRQFAEKIEKSLDKIKK